MKCAVVVKDITPSVTPQNTGDAGVTIGRVDKPRRVGRVWERLTVW